MQTNPTPDSDNPNLYPAPEAFEPVDVNDLAPEEQMARFLLWLRVHDAGHQPC